MAGRCCVLRNALVLVLLAATVLTVATTANAADTDRVGVLTLINGNTVKGVLRASDSSDMIRWHGSSFHEPLEFRTGAIKSIKFPVEQARNVAQGEFSFEFRSGDVITGQLVGWSYQTMEIDSPQFGKMAVHPQSVRRLHRIDENARSSGGKPFHQLFDCQDRLCHAAFSSFGRHPAK